MIFTETKLKGAFILELEKLEDERGFFARTWCRREFTEHGLNPNLVQSSISVNHKSGTIRGMHYQIAPYEEAKLVQCFAGAIYDVIIDLRSGSTTFAQWIAIELTAANHRIVYIPEGFAHGFQTLDDDSVVFYQMSEFYNGEYARGIRWNDPAFAVQWPDGPRVLSDRDRNYPNYSLTT
jgi:dTDP-4-dehydrorhamnose 3,5-epimerase